MRIILLRGQFGIFPNLFNVGPVVAAIEEAAVSLKRQLTGRAHHRGRTLPIIVGVCYDATDCPVILKEDTTTCRMNLTSASSAEKRLMLP